MKSRITIPKTFMGIPIEGAIERALAEEKGKSEAPTPATSSIILPDSKKMIYVPEVNLHFAKQKTHLNEDWHQTHKSLADEGLRMPTMNEFRAYLKHLNHSSNSEYKTIYNEITEIRTPWRFCWIDVYFEERKTGIISKELYLLTHNKTKEEKLETCLMQDKNPGISLDGWLDYPTVNQGFPREGIGEGSLYYWHPRNGAVAGFIASSNRANLYCDRNPSYRDPSLGVYAVSEAGGNAR